MLWSAATGGRLGAYRRFRGSYAYARRLCRKPFREVRLATPAQSGLPKGMSHLLEDERSSAAIWWDKFANFAWRTDWTQVVVIALLSSLGVVAIHSAGIAKDTGFYR